MSILKFERRTPRTIAAMYAYMVDPSKTDGSYVFGIGVNPFYTAEEMEFIQRLYYKEDIAHTYLQVIVSFDAGISCDERTRSICQEIAGVLVEDERQILGVIHYKNEKNVHCHYMINYVSITGKLYRQRRSVFYYKRKVNEILLKYGLNPIPYNEWYRRELLINR